MSSLAFAPPHLDDSDDEEVLIQFDDTAFEPSIPSEEDFEDQVREAQEQLAQLRQREEQLERQKRELEELHQRKAVFTENRDVLHEELTRAIAALNRESEECQRRADDCLNTREALDHYLRTVDSLRPDMWSRNQLKEELGKAQGRIDEAEEELRSASPLLASIRGGKSKIASAKRNASASNDETGQGFLYWFKSGLAFTLPVMIFLAVFGLIFLVFGGS
ncbi:MAG: hypothetical protein KDN19_17345 [Verrucomicrobiae bacterium]|nr:hypothetical protein [Verrucomicrobiae bacterium]